MMSGDDRENGPEKKENDGAEGQDEVRQDGVTGATDTESDPLLSSLSDKKSYPFSVPEENVSEESAPEEEAQPDTLDEAVPHTTDELQEPTFAQHLSAEEETPAVEDVVSALAPEVSEPEVPEEALSENAEDITQAPHTGAEGGVVAEESGEAREEEVDAALDEGLFSDEVLPEEGIEAVSDQMPEEEEPQVDLSQRPDTPQDEASIPEEGTHTEGMADEPGERQEPYVAQTAAADGINAGAQAEGPKHAFDTGDPVMSEQEYAQSVKKKSGLGVVLVSVIIMFLLVGVVIGGGFFYVKLKFDAPGSQPQQLSHVIKPKQGLKEIAADLEDKGIIEDKNIFMIGSYISGDNKSLQAGEFEFAPNASMKDVLETITKGKVIQHKITLAEGLTSQQIVEIINDNPVLKGEIETLPPEGSLLPETYQFTRGMTRQQIIARMQKAQKDLIEKLWPNRADNLGVVTPADAIVLASIVEKETGLSNERGRVAAVFNNRLNKKMRLQSDPTVIYGIVGGEGKLDRPIRRSDLDEQTPYNTYKIDGLPPTPIANPGKASLEAVLRPASTNDLYFVADGTGGHAFATTLKEHNENVARWRKIERGVAVPEIPQAEEAKSAAEEKAKQISTPKPVEKLKSTAAEKAGALQKTVTPKNDAQSIAETPVKSDKVLPKVKPKVQTSDPVKKAVEEKDSLTEKVRAIFVKPEEAPLPRSKPNVLIEQGIDKINVTPLPEQKVPSAPSVPPARSIPQTVPQVQQPTVPQTTVPQTIQPGGEPTPELETSTPRTAPVQRQFNPFED